MFKKLLFILIALAALALRSEALSANREDVMEQALATSAIQVSDEGERLAAILDGFDVEHHWLANKSVNWETGENIWRPIFFKKPHCSSFVAAVAKKLGIYILRPPQHPEKYLANAQNLWLSEHGREYGWEQVPTAIEAQILANEGHFVVASYRHPDPRKPGHIAIVRPFAKSEETVEEEGPQIIQAGSHNYNSTSVKVGFKEFLRDSKGDKILYFSHKISRPGGFYL